MIPLKDSSTGVAVYVSFWDSFTANADCLHERDAATPEARCIMRDSAYMLSETQSHLPAAFRGAEEMRCQVDAALRSESESSTRELESVAQQLRPRSRATHAFLEL